MQRIFYSVLWVSIFFFVEMGSAQVSAIQLDSVLTFQEYLGYVKQHHPLVKQANLQLSVGEANLLKARGGFDPKIEVDYDRKKFKGIEYYDQLNAAFKIPTWYGVEFKANFEENTGEFLDPSLTVPRDGLYSAGVSFSLAQGFLINERMATLKKAQVFVNQSEAERDLLVNQIMFEASLTYFEWIEAFNEEQIYKTFLTNAEIRFKGVKRSVEEGQVAAIDSTEARIILRNRKLNLEAAGLKRRKAALKVSNYLWIDQVPLQIADSMVPKAPSEGIMGSSLFLSDITIDTEILSDHPILRRIDAKLQALEVDRRLNRNKLLPKVDLQYNFLTSDGDQISSLNTANYKAGLNISFPLFLRKERGDLKLSNLRIKDTDFERATKSLALQNKISAVTQEVASLALQNDYISDIVEDHQILVAAEERKFQLGESSLFLVNSREQKLIAARLRSNKLLIELLNANASLYNALGLQ